jgi:hypothetical protein
MTTIGVVEYFPTLLANWHVSHATEANPPWLLMLSLISSLLIALLLAHWGFGKTTDADGSDEELS